MSRNFWNSCPRKLEFFPEQACPLGKLASESKEQNQWSCQWYINSPDDSYCFWKWTRRRSDENGYMQPLLHKEITRLLGYSGTKIHFMLKDAVDAVLASPEFQQLNQLLDEEE